MIQCASDPPTRKSASDLILLRQSEKIHLRWKMLMYFFFLLNTQHLIVLGSSESSIPEYSMAESLVFQDIEYLLCGYRVTWDEAQIICLSYKAQLATLDSELKSDFVVRAIAESSFGFDDFWIGARSDLAGSWSWVSKQQGLATEKSLYQNYPPWYPTSPTKKMQCLTIDRRNHDLPIFVSLSCSQLRPFVCQKDENAMFARKISMIATTRVGDEEFTVYSARVTWPEAVIQCRKEKLQIAEVRSVVEAHAVAMSMLRARPEGIENAWIGGYLKDATWTWLPSANEISQDAGLWRNGSRSSHGCLMLDRHTCETPVYLEAKCDRKRDVVCQKPSRKPLSKEPVLVSIEGCKYWLGFYPLQWLEARRACSELNATLVILDSERTINHIMKLMLENRKELKHVWTDGRRRSSPARNSYETFEGDWLWESTQERIPQPGESFVPWCNTEKYINGTECLNLDREDYDTPMVYGLDCNHSQTYVCQPLSSPCVSHEISSSSIYDDMSSAKELAKPADFFLTQETTASKGWFPYQSKTSERPIATLRMNTVYAKIFHITLTLPSSTTSPNVQGFATLPSSALWHQIDKSLRNDSKVNIKHISHDNVGTISKTGFTDFLRPFFQLSFPTLPQFGIKLVSAQTTRTLSILQEKQHESTDKITKALFDISSSEQRSRTTKSTTISLLASTVLSDVDFERSRKLLDFVTPSSVEHTSVTQGGNNGGRTGQDSGISKKFPNSSSNVKTFEPTTPAQKKLNTNVHNGAIKLPFFERNVSEESDETYLSYSSTLPMNLESTTVSSVPAVAEINTISSSMAIISARTMQYVTSEKHSNSDIALSAKNEFQQGTSSSKNVEPVNSNVPNNRWQSDQRNQSNGYNFSKGPTGPTILKQLWSINTLTNWTRDTPNASSHPIDHQNQMKLQSSSIASRSTPSSAGTTVKNSWDIKTKSYSIAKTIRLKNSTEGTFQKNITKIMKNPLKTTKKIALGDENLEDGGTISWEGNGSPDKKKKGNKLKNPFQIHEDAINSQREEEKEEDEDYLYDDGPAPIRLSAVTKSYITIIGGIRKNFDDIAEYVHEEDTETENSDKVEDKSLLIKKLLLHAKSRDDKLNKLKNASNRKVEQTTVPYSRRMNVNAFSLRPYYVLERPLNLNFNLNGNFDETATSSLNKGSNSEDSRTDHFASTQNSDLKSTDLDVPNIWDLVNGMKIDFNSNALTKFLQRHNIKQSNKNGGNNVSHNEFSLFSNALNGMNGFQIDFNGNPIRVSIKTSSPDDPYVLSESSKLTGAGRSVANDNTGSSNFLQLFLKTGTKSNNYKRSPNLLHNFSTNIGLANDTLTRIAELYLNIHTDPYTPNAYTRPITEPESSQLNSSRNKSLLEKLINPRNESDDLYYNIFESLIHSGQLIGLNRKRYLLYLVLRQLINMTESDLKLYDSRTVTSNDSFPRGSLIDFQKRLHQVFSQSKNPKIILSQNPLPGGISLTNRSINENSPNSTEENEVPTLFIRASFEFEKNSANKKPSRNLDRH